MANPLFRETALQNLSSPEQLEQMMKITRPRAWLVLATLGFVLAATLLWSVFGSLPSTISGQGIIVRQGGTYNIVSLGSGVVVDFEDFKTGQPIRKGQTIGRVTQPLLSLQRDAALAEVQRLEKQQASISSEIALEQPARSRSARQQADIQRAAIRSREQFLASLKEKLSQQSELLADGLITRQRFEESRQAIFSAENDISTAGNALQSLDIQALTNQSGFDERTRQMNAALTSARSRLADLTAQLELASNVVSTHDGLVVEVLVSKGDIVTVNQPVLSVEEPVRSLEALIYMPPQSEAKRILPGMTVQLSPVTARKERYGFLVGKVTSVSKYPSSEQGMQAVFNNPGLVRELTKQGPPIAVAVALIPDSDTKSGYQWSSSAARQLDLSSGTLAVASFTIEVQKPISLVIPMLKQTVGL
ncbi:NHLP bacteriocin system secretion protein [Polaromonas sp.]|uniref:NHLP bacteriocin system secretion protein n=1 Tax=Polaromonas sp. TaxID=1869339 RepID=UPI0017A78135|nr:NHLP bacteriocin system secretion protein [Polaromonas sp.]NML85210.1 NHLP bacteriocin system secretion protein [Polaromonas sp.]